MIFDLDSTVVTVFGNQQDAAIGYNPRYRGKKSYDPLLCMEANSSFLWDAELRPGNAGTWDGILEVLDISFANAHLRFVSCGSAPTPALVSILCLPLWKPGLHSMP